MRLCRLCGENPVSPSCLKRFDYRCARCRHQTPAARAYQATYSRSANRRAVVARSNAKRICVGGVYHSMARTVGDARRINAVIKERLREFIARRSYREETESATACGISSQTAI